MPDPNVKMSVFANAEAAERALVSLEKKYANLENKMKQVSRASRRAKDESIIDLGAVGTKLLGLAAGYTSITAIINKATEASIEWEKAIDSAAKKGDEATRKMNVGYGAFGADAERVAAAAVSAAQRAAIPLDEARRLVPEASRSGLPLESMDELFTSHKVTAAGAKGGVGFADFADEIGDILKRSGREATEAAVAEMGRQMFAMMRGTEVTIPDLENVQEHLRTAKGGKGAVRRKKALGQMGLKFENVDLVGEDVFQALEKIQIGLEKIAPEKRGATLKNFGFGADLTDRMIEGMQARSRNLEIYDASVAEMTTGRAAGEIRDQNLEQLHKERSAKNYTMSERIAALGTMDIASGRNFLQRGVLTGARWAGGGAGAIFGREAEALTMMEGFGGMTGLIGQAVSGRLGGVRETSEGIIDAKRGDNPRMLELLERIANNTGVAADKAAQPARNPDRGGR